MVGGWGYKEARINIEVCDLAWYAKRTLSADVWTFQFSKYLRPLMRVDTAAFVCDKCRLVWSNISLTIKIT